MKQPHTTPPAPGARQIFITPVARRMNEAQLRAALTSIPDDDPRLMAIQQIINDELQEAMLAVSSPLQNPALGTHAGGRIDALITVKGEIDALRK